VAPRLPSLRCLILPFLSTFRVLVGEFLAAEQNFEKRSQKQTSQASAILGLNNCPKMVKNKSTKAETYQSDARIQIISSS
jgi:hypothetical protein